MITIIPMAHHNSTDSQGTYLELDPTPPSGFCFSREMKQTRTECTC